MTIKKALVVAALIAGSIGLAACTDANVASQNISEDADNFRIVRKVTFINGITDNVLLEVVGRCSITADAAEPTPKKTGKVSVWAIPDEPNAIFYSTKTPEETVTWINPRFKLIAIVDWTEGDGL